MQLLLPAPWESPVLNAVGVLGRGHCVCVHACMCVCVCVCVCAQSSLTLWDPVDCSSPGSSVHGILQTSILKRIVILISRGSSWPTDGTWVSCISGGFFTILATREALVSVVLVYNSTPWPRLKSKPGNQLFWGLFRDLNRNILIPIGTPYHA